jgi:hypothetical protein
MNHDFFVCQREQNYYPEITCGVASMMMLLKFRGLLGGLTYRELADQMGLAVSPVRKGYPEPGHKFGIYPEDLYRFLVKREIPFRVSFFKDEWEACLANGPIMVLMADEEEGGRFAPYGHWVVLVGVENGVFTYLDPWYSADSGEHLRHIGMEDFYRHYTGSACQILAPGETRA